MLIFPKKQRGRSFFSPAFSNAPLGNEEADRLCLRAIGHSPVEQPNVLVLRKHDAVIGDHAIVALCEPATLYVADLSDCKPVRVRDAATISVDPFRNGRTITPALVRAHRIR
jgi:hypothetical protein